MEELWERGGGLAELPSRTDEIIPEELQGDEFDKLDAVELALYLKKRAKAVQMNYDLHGLRCTFQYKMDIAKR